MTNLLYSAKHYQIKGSKEADRAKYEADRAKSYAESVNSDNLLNKSMITNCITKIPQDIKLELVDGTLTLKAGSKVYVPNGFEADGVTPKFDIIITETDSSMYKDSGSGTLYCLISLSGMILDLWVTGETVTARPENPVRFASYYNTTTNICEYCDSAGNWIRTSFPIAIVSRGSSGYSLNQTFNGLGYIGSTFFVLPGVEALWSNGFNTDGSLKNGTVTISRVLTQARKDGTDTERNLILHYTGTACQVTGTSPSNWKYYPDKNKYIYLTNNDYGWINVGTCTVDPSNNWKITSFSPKTAFHAVDYRDVEDIVNNLTKHIVVSTLPSSPDADTFYYIPE